MTGDHDEETGGSGGSPAPGEGYWKTVGARYGLLAVWAAMITAYGVAAPEAFLAGSTARIILSSQSSLIFLAIAAMCPMLTGDFDLSFAAVMGVSATLVPVLSAVHQVNLWLACLVAVAAGAVCGAVNALFIVRFRIGALVVTLGTASLYVGISELISSSNTVSIHDQRLTNLVVTTVFGLPLSFYYSFALCVGFAYLLSWTPLGLKIAFVGANPEVARLAGVDVNRLRALSYLAGGVIAALAGIMLVATVGGFDPTGSFTYILPAFAAVFLSTAVVTPGRFNPLGTLIGFYFLETGVIGLQILGYTGWVHDTFYGAGLVLAVTLATLVRTRTSSA